MLKVKQEMDVLETKGKKSFKKKGLTSFLKWCLVN